MGLALAPIGGHAACRVLSLAQEKERRTAVMEPRLILAYTLIALLIAAAAVGLGLALTLPQRRQRRERQRELARRERGALRKESM